MFYFNELKRYEKWFKSKETFNIDYSYKSYLLNNNADKEVNNLSWNCHLNILYKSYNISDYYVFSDDILKIYYNSLVDKFGFIGILESMRLINARYHRLSRLRDRVGNLISYGTSYFLTLTFTNNVLSSTQYHVRRKYVSRYLKSISNDYVANIDFGSRNHREHYHAVVNADYIDSKLWKYGNLDFELINNSNELSNELLSKYITKLSNHAIKETCKRNHLIYPKYRK